MRKSTSECVQWIMDETVCAKCTAEEATTMKKRVVEVNDDAAVGEDSSGSSDGDDCFKIVPSARIYTMNNIMF